MPMGEGVEEEEMLMPSVDQVSASRETIEPDTFRLHRNDNFQRRRNVNNDQPNEEKFGKLKFSMPKFEGTYDPDAYLT